MLPIGAPEKPTVIVLVPLVTAKLELRLPCRFRLAVVAPTPKLAPDVVRLGAVTALLKVLLPLKVWLPLSSATLALRRESLKVPDETLEALRLVKPEPLPVKELEALENVLLPEKVWLALSFARLASLLKLALLI